MTNEQFAAVYQQKTKDLALAIIFFSKTLPKSEEAIIIKRQLLRAATSTAANYRAACRARSKAEFHAKLSIVVEEADETLFWLELLEEANLLSHGTELNTLKFLATEILQVMAKARKNSKPTTKNL